MKTVATLLLCCSLAACSSTSQDSTSSGGFPVTIPHLTSSVSPASSQVEVSITVKSEYREPLKTVRVTIAAFDAKGQKLSGNDEVIEVLGPILRGQSIGPLEKVTSIRDSRVTCIEVVQIQAIKLDYTLDSVVGKDAHAAVTGGGQKACNG